MPLTVLAVADQVSDCLYDRFQRDRWAHIDLILSCGDLPPTYLDFLCSMFNVPVLFVRGNHDGQYSARDYQGCSDVHGKIVRCKGLRVAGFEGSLRYNEREPEYTEAQMRRKVWRSRARALLTGAPDIVLTHAPPYGCHDASDPCHQGFHAFRTAIDAWQPAFWIHGHMHAYEGAQPPATIGTTSVINAYPYTVFQVPVAADRADNSLLGTTGVQS